MLQQKSGCPFTLLLLLITRREVTIVKAINITEIAAKVGGQVFKGSLYDDVENSFSAIRSLETAKKDNISFFAPTSKKATSLLFEQACNSGAGVILVEKYYPEIKSTQIACEHPTIAVVDIAEFLHTPTSFNTGIHATAVVDDTATIGSDVVIGPYCVVGAGVTVGNGSKLYAHVTVYPNASIGEDCELHANSVIRENVILENCCLIQPGVVIGGEGFGYIPDPKLGHRRIPHMGSVKLHQGVDVGANASIDRGTFGVTEIGRDTKIDSLVQIGHNNKLGERVLVCAMTGVGGSGSVGNDTILGGHVGVADHVHIASKVRIGGKTGVSSDVTEPGDYLGSFRAEPATQFWKELASIRSIPKLIAQFRDIKKRLKKLENE